MALGLTTIYVRLNSTSTSPGTGTGNAISFGNQTAAGTYTVTVTDSLSCESSKTFTVTQPDELEVTIVETSPFVLELSTVTGGTPSYTYAWYESGNSVGTGTSYIVSSNGTYSLEATDANNCTNTSNSITYNVASVINGEEVSFRVYPNPFREEATVDFGYETANSVAMFLGKDGIFLGVQPNSSANLVSLTNEVEKVSEQIILRLGENGTILNGTGLYKEQNKIERKGNNRLL